MPGGDALAVEVRAGGSLRCSWAGAVLLGWSEKGKEAGLGWGEEGRRERFGPPGWVWAFYFLSSFLFQTKLKLFEFKLEFEFNPSTKTNKTMGQHECTNKLALK